jgi:hypothetical protein
MKAILKFDLSNPEDQHNFDRVNKALNMAVAIWEYDQYLRGEYKHGENEHAYAFRKKFREFLTDNDLDIDRLLQ